ncbi:MAG: biotin--[acetyl-CoA-carboxylase] ligase [Anaerolineales bacterium]
MASVYLRDKKACTITDVNADRLWENLIGLPIPEIKWFDSIGSTNDVALQWAEKGAPDGALVVADHQSAGRGRMQRRWITPAGSALAFSLILRPRDDEMIHLTHFSGLGALSVSKALDELGLKSEVKWPNDVLIARKKTAGVLVELVWQADQLQALVIGIGLNVAPASIPPLPEVVFPATCVETMLGKEINRWELLESILRHIFLLRPRLGETSFMKEWEERLAFYREWVQVEQPDQTILVGQVIGIDEEGGLRLLTENQDFIVVTAGDVRLRPIVGQNRWSETGGNPC